MARQWVSPPACLTQLDVNASQGETARRQGYLFVPNYTAPSRPYENLMQERPFTDRDGAEPIPALPRCKSKISGVTGRVALHGGMR